MIKKYLIFAVLIIAVFLRTYRASVLTGFYFDQGRDAKIIWDLIHNHKFFMIGPTTGIEGIFLGPFYYYLISPFYLLGGGNPVFPAVGLALICVAGIWIIYKIASDYFTQSAGIISAVLITFSLEMVQSNRWLSNPTPLYLSSALAVLLLLKIIHKSERGLVWFCFGLILGLSLQFEAASAVFFLPATLIILLIFRKDVVWQTKNVVHTLFAFLITLLPQIIFDLRHGNILFLAFYRFLLSEKSFLPSGADFYPVRLAFYFDSFFHKFTLEKTPAIIIAVFLCISFILAYRLLPKKPINTLLIWVITPLVILLFYRGNYGYIWSYYFTGVFFVFMLITGTVLDSLLKIRPKFITRILVGVFIIYFVSWNSYHLYHYLIARPDGETAIMLGSSLAAVDWVYQDAGSQPFNVDVYVPPVITHSYDYLFLWRGNTKYAKQPDPNIQPRLYTLYEADPPHPERLEAWQKRQAGYAQIETSTRFGGIGVDRRLRFK